MRIAYSKSISTIDTVSAGHIYLGGTDITEIKEKDQQSKAYFGR